MDNILPQRPVSRLVAPIQRFLHIEAAGGLVLFCCTALALFVANSPWASWYQGIWNQPLGVTLGNFSMSYPLWYWVNDALMAVFFFVIGLEIKRELTTGELSDKRKVVLPVAAAIGGATAPAIIFHLLQSGQPGQSGWAIPMATDIAFVVGAISLFGKRAPHGLKVFLLSVAIVDDLLAVSVIAVFYAESIRWTWMLISAGGFGLVALLNRLGVRAISVYLLTGGGIWYAVHHAGIHPTVAGVILGLMTPSRSLIERNTIRSILTSLQSTFEQASEDKGRIGSVTLAQTAQFAAKESVPPSDRLENALHPWVVFVIMPLFALANAAAPFNETSLGDSLSLAIIVGLVVGKPIGILATSYAVVKMRWTKLPESLNWTIMLGAGLISGIGFTMSLFIAQLGLGGDLLQIAKGGVLVASAVSLVIGCGVLLLALKARNYRSNGS